MKKFYKKTVLTLLAFLLLFATNFFVSINKNNHYMKTPVVYAAVYSGKVSITSDKVSPQPSKSSIIIKASGSSSSLIYRFWIHDGYSWTIVQDYSTNNSYNWVPQRSGNYRIWVDVKDKTSKNDYDSYKEINYYIRDVAKINSLTTDKPAPQTSSIPIKISTGASGSSNVLYRYWIHDGYSWKVVQDYSSNNSYNWVPQKSGTYRIWVDAKDKYSSNDVDSYKEIYYKINDINLSSITTDKASPQIAGSPINITTNASGSSNMLYRFWIHDGVSWKVVQDYTSSSSYKWTPVKAATYRIWVDVKDKYSLKDVDTYKEIYYKVNSPSANISSITSDKISPQLIGSSINITANATGSSNILYRFWIHDGTSWSIVQDYSSGNSYSWIPSKTGTYRIWVDVRDKYSSNDVDSYKEIYYTINKVSASINSITTDKLSPQSIGTPIQITANATGSSNILYRFWIHDGTSWSIVQNYSSNKSYSWNPSKLGRYRIWIDVKEGSSSNDVDSYKEITYDIINQDVRINSIVTDKPSPQSVGANIKITANASGSSELLYRFWIYDGSWKVVQDYSRLNIYNWSPVKTGSHRIWVDVKDKNSLKDVDYSSEIYYRIGGYKVFIDPGHGGSDPGAVGVSGAYEKNISLSIANKVRNELLKYNVEVMMSRNTDVYIGLYDRAKIANEQLSDVFVSIHENSYTSPSANGIETYYYSTNSEGKKLAEALQSVLISNTQAINKGVKTANYVVIRETKMASALVETGFMSNPTEEAKLKTEEYQTKLAKSIAGGILKYLGISY